MYDFSGETVLVTGGTKGIGKETARLFLEHGGTVVVNYYNDDDAAAQTLGEFEAADLPGDVQLKQFDVADESAVDEAVKDVWEKHGPIRRLINNAGIMANAGPLLGMDKEDWDSVIDVNLDGVFNVTNSVGTRMIVNGVDGAMVNIASITAKRGFAGEPHYCASKGGVVSMTRSLARELGRRNIRVNAVLPGYTETDMADEDYLPGISLEDLHRKELSQVPLGQRMADPEEIAEVIVFVASDRASYMTGSEVRVDGGRIA